MKAYKEQLDAVSVAIQEHRGCISMPTGSGKSVTMALLINALQVKTLIVVPNITLKNQLSESFTQYFGSLNNISIENIQSPKLKNMNNYDCLIIDEAHHVAAKTYRYLNRYSWGGIYYRYFFTATPFRSKTEEQMLMTSISGEVIYELTYKTAVEKEYIVPIEAFYIEVPHTDMEKNPNSWPAVYSELVVNNIQRNQLINQMLSLLSDDKLSTLCLVKEIAHGNMFNYPFANGVDGESNILIKKYNSDKITTLIGTTGILGEGVDTRAAEYIIIAGLGKSKNAFMQQIGRGLRKYPGKESCKVIIFRDSSHKWTLAHFNEQVKVLWEEYSVKPVKLEI